MQERKITITLEQAKEWYNSDNATLKEIALQAFNEEELNTFDFTKIKTFKDALLCICKFNSCEYNSIVETINRLRILSKASAAMFQLNIIKRVLNKGYNMHITKDADGQNCMWYPYFRLITSDCTWCNGELRRVGIKNIGQSQNEEKGLLVLGGVAANDNTLGLGCFDASGELGYVSANVGFLGCATEEIAKHFGLYFGTLIMEAMYGDMVDFQIVKE